MTYITGLKILSTRKIESKQALCLVILFTSCLASIGGFDDSKGFISAVLFQQINIKWIVSTLRFKLYTYYAFRKSNLIILWLSCYIIHLLWVIMTILIILLNLAGIALERSRWLMDKRHLDSLDHYPLMILSIKI